MTELPKEFARCQGATSTFMGARTLAHGCVDCMRRTADRTYERIWWINPPKTFPCSHRITQAELEAFE